MFSALPFLVLFTVYEIVKAEESSYTTVANAEASLITTGLDGSQTDAPGPIPSGLDHFNSTYLNELDRSHLDSNFTLLGARRDSCDGSFYCSWKPLFSHKAEAEACNAAFFKFEEFALYTGYTSYFQDHCVAIFQCPAGFLVPGWRVRRRFQQIRDNGCKICGTHFFGIRKAVGKICYVKLDYCWNCKQAGGPADFQRLDATNSSAENIGDDDFLDDIASEDGSTVVNAILNHTRSGGGDIVAEAILNHTVLESNNASSSVRSTEAVS